MTMCLNCIEIFDLREDITNGSYIKVILYGV